MDKSEDKICLGVDWGMERIGLALGHQEVKLASPWGVVGSLAEVLDVAKEEGVELIVLGQPVKMSGEREKLDSRFMEFADKLKAKSGLPLKLIDERLTSKSADVLSAPAKNKVARDAVAAMLILQSYFDSL